MRNSETEQSDRLLVGVEEMAAVTGQPARRLRHWIRSGFITCVVKRGALLTASRNALKRELGLD
jgi:hypothetical protein